MSMLRSAILNSTENCVCNRPCSMISLILLYNKFTLKYFRSGYFFSHPVNLMNICILSISEQILVETFYFNPSFFYHNKTNEALDVAHRHSRTQQRERNSEYCRWYTSCWSCKPKEYIKYSKNRQESERKRSTDLNTNSLTRIHHTSVAHSWVLIRKQFAFMLVTKHMWIRLKFSRALRWWGALESARELAWWRICTTKDIA